VLGSWMLEKVSRESKKESAVATGFRIAQPRKVLKRIGERGRRAPQPGDRTEGPDSD